MIKFYGYKKCGTCRKAEKILVKLGLEYTFIDITESPPTAVNLKKMAIQAGISPRKLFNTSGVQYREQDIKSRLPELSEAMIFSLLASNGRLIKRPIVSDGQRTTVGFQEPHFLKTWS